MTVFSADLPPSAAGRWCRVVLSVQAAGAWWAKLEMADSARDQIVREAFFPGTHRWEPNGRRVLLMHVPAAAGRLTLSVFATGTALAHAPEMFLRVLGRAAAALRLVAGGWRLLPLALRGSPRGLLGRVRAMLGQYAARRGQVPPYPVWIDLFDMWGERERHALLSHALSAAIDVAIVADGTDAALAKTVAALHAQWHRPRAMHVIRKAADWRLAGGDWLVILGAGECLAPQALACLALAVRNDSATLGLCADFDRGGPGGARALPALRPPPDPWLMRSPLFAEGAWMFRRAAIAAEWGRLPHDAHGTRLALARALPAALFKRVPLILTHCPPARAAEHMPPPTLSWQAGKAWPCVSILVPSACRSWHVLRCLESVARHTDYETFEILVVVSCLDTADRKQARILRKLAELPRVRLILLDMPVFNFAAVVNHAAREASGSLLLLQNDDVVPIEPSWLSTMVGFTVGEDGNRADIVGARLLYGNGLVQHAGVIMGLANLCEHAFRLARRHDPGPQGLAHLARQVSGVTGACLLVRRDLFESLGGLDAGFAIALNDVDFCLRAGAQGARIVIAAGVALYHFESLSLGRHYQGVRAELEATETRRLRDRWAVHILADPFYHPCASLEMGREFEPGFPPRQTPLSWIGQEARARH